MYNSQYFRKPSWWREVLHEINETKWAGWNTERTFKQMGITNGANIPKC